MKRVLLVAASLALLTACSQPEGDSQHGVSTDPNAATGFIMANPDIPEGVAIKEGDTVARDTDGRPYTYALLNQPLPPLSGRMANGQTFDSATLDTWTIIDVWGLWCGDCMVDAPYVAALVTAIEQDPDLQFLSIHSPANASRTSDEEMFGKYGSVSSYFAQKGYSYPTLIDTDASMRDALQISWTPSYILVDPDGMIRGFRTDLSVAGGDPVKDFLKDVARVKSELRKADAGGLVRHASIGPDGAMGLTGAVPFNTDAIRTSFPDTEIVPGQHVADMETYPFFEVYGDPADMPLYRLEPDWQLGQVARVSTANPAVTGPAGEHVGAFYLSDLPDTQRADCIDGADEEAALTFCSQHTENTTFQHVFAQTADKSDAVLVRMTYVPASRMAVD